MKKMCVYNLYIFVNQTYLLDKQKKFILKLHLIIFGHLEAAEQAVKATLTY